MAQHEELIQQQTPFQPNKDKPTKEGPLTARHREQERMYGNKWDFLHADSMRKTKQNKNDLTKDEIDYDREKDEYTFHPNKAGGINPESQRTNSSSPNRKNGRGSPIRGEPFEMNVNIGGQRLSLKTDTAADPHVAARKFMKANNLEDKFLNTLVEIISDQQRQIINQY